MSIPIIATKLRPPLSAGLIARPRLVASLKPDPQIQLTLVTGGAGYGKTSVLSGLISETGLPAVWYKLDVSDRDPVQFLAYLIRGTQQAVPGLVDELNLMLAGAGADAYLQKEHLFRAFLGRLAAFQGEGLLLVLDDFQEVGQSADIVGLTELLVDLSPARVHIFVASREEPRLPLGRLRARGQLRWVPAQDLRFTAEEIEQLLLSQGLDLGHADIAVINRISEGWVASLALLSGVLRALGKRERAEILMRGTLQPALNEFLAQEVFERQDAGMREFLLATCVADPLLPQVCDEVLGTGSSTAYLEAACIEHLLISRLEGSDPAYRYHPLFREFLQERLASEGRRLSELHRKWGWGWEGVGDKAQAIEHYLQGQDERALALVEEIGPDFLERGQAETVDAWLRRIPEETLSRRSGLRYLRGLTLHHLGRLREAISSLDSATTGFLAEGQRERAYGSRFLSAHTLLLLGDWMPAAEGCREAMDLAPDLRRRLHGLILLGCSFLFGCRWQEAMEHWSLAIEQAGGDYPLEKARAIGFLAMLKLWQGDFVGACLHSREALRLLEGSADVLHYVRLLNNHAYFLVTTARYRRARLCARRCLALAEEHYFAQEKPDILDTLGLADLASARASGVGGLEAALELMRDFRNSLGEAITLLNLGVHFRRVGELQRSVYHLEHAYRLIDAHASPYHRSQILVELARALWMRGKKGKVEGLRAEAKELCERLGFRHTAFRLQLHRIQEALAGGEMGEIEMRLRETLREARRYQYNDYLVQEGRSSLAVFTLALEKGIEAPYVCFLVQKMGQDAVRKLPRFLPNPTVEQRLILLRLFGRLPAPLAAQEAKRYLRDDDGQVRAAAQEAFARIAAGEGGRSSAGKAPALESLTKREAEIFSRAARGFSNRRLAEELVMSEATLKTHLKRIYRKLRISNRGELTSLAAELGKKQGELRR